MKRVLATIAIVAVTAAFSVTAVIGDDAVHGCSGIAIDVDTACRRSVAATGVDTACRCSGPAIGL